MKPPEQPGEEKGRAEERGYAQPSWGARVAAETGDSRLGLEHALLAMIRDRETVPARALAGLADLDVLDAAVAPAGSSSGPIPRTCRPAPVPAHVHQNGGSRLSVAHFRLHSAQPGSQAAPYGVP